MHPIEQGKRFIQAVRNAVVDDALRSQLLFRVINSMLCLVAFGMTVVNVFTSEYLLMVATLVFSVLCGLNVGLSYWKRVNMSAVRFCFEAEFFALLAFFFISGIPDGFSALWVCLIPSFSVLIFGMRKGTYLSLLALVGMIFLFWFPQGRALLQYSYSPTFMLRFPFLYSAMLAISTLVEYIRSETQKTLSCMESKYKLLYGHDALTGLYNRYGMNEILDKLYENPEHRKLSVMILDIDDFKLVNDRYGHNAGDAVLEYVAKVLEEESCEHCSCARWGGEEFLLLMECKHDPVEVAEKLRHIIETTEIPYEDQSIHITMSVGVFTAGDMSEYSINELVKYADQCLYRSKAEGKNRVTHR